MRINTVNPYNNSVLRTTKSQKTPKKYNNSASTPDIYPPVHYLQTFRGKIPISKLYEEYNWYINCDKIPAINAFLKINAPKEVMNTFLFHILSTADRGYELIDSIVNQPRNIGSIAKNLEEKLGSDSKFFYTFMPNNEYNQAYAKYIEQKYNNANSIIELLKFRPDWRGSMLIAKTKQLGEDNLTIGRIPKQIGKDHIYKIFDYLKDKMEVGIKSDKKIDNFVIDGKTFEFKYFTEGKSSKNVFGLFVPSVGKKYVIKMDSPERRSLDEPFAIGTLAKIDSYLTCNRSRNSAPLCFYDHENNFSIYKYIEHSHVSENPHDIGIIRSKLPDFRTLGLDFNDNVGNKNFFVLNERSLDTYDRMEGFREAIPKAEWISVDNDHVTYSGKLQPSITKFHAPLPNAMGICV